MGILDRLFGQSDRAKTGSANKATDSVSLGTVQDRVAATASAIITFCGVADKNQLDGKAVAETEIKLAGAGVNSAGGLRLMKMVQQEVSRRSKYGAYVSRLWGGIGSWPRQSSGVIVDLRSDDEQHIASRSQGEHVLIFDEQGVTDLIPELVGLVKADNSGFANKARIREIGEALNAKGGLKLMQEAYYYVRGDGTHFSRDIWDRIGKWQA